ncbi:hypothetical protein [Nocardia arthritidis]|uniref:Uncharacterized protein n=1 Tax=Nocardia arthritidis TaxID=228602 RepID=A0A6G9YLH9_9NOCA|nr:hypothetical protein [Nocardia arthritidis]QIS14041.1 hypothetical protein F5544_30990 [Nocardia arthritidis]
MSSIEADALKVVWALDFQFDFTVDGRAVKIASSTADRIVAGLEKVCTAH